ncbi:hypothetical protein EW026_g3089 [Hermanssonia centrifuga]|uniref:ABC transporter domain-containing protein n=1 Tax=Hermanssonia centrifuga TaxID=98765 RepID=A0A4S4KN61_9APHY|nr:hypothetical protein EW026_g3089 [Hermanssonia centrifuga]
MGSQVAPPTYNFGAVYITDDVLLQGGMDHDGNLNARFNQAWAKDKTNVTKMQASLTPGHNMLQLEHEYQGQDYSLNIKGMNPSPIDSTGIYIGSILQSLTKNLALGVEAIYQRPQPDVSEMAASYVAKYTSSNKDWIATTQMQPSQGVLQATYWQKFGEKVEVAADLMLIAAPTRRDAIATLGARYDLRMSSFRAQLDSTGKVSVLHEQRFAPAFAFLLSGEIDHFRAIRRLFLENDPFNNIAFFDRKMPETILNIKNVNEGDVLILQGKSGCGKTTLLKCLAHLNVYEGELEYRGKPPRSYGIPAFRTRILYVPQRPSLLPGTPRDFLTTISKFKARSADTSVFSKHNKTTDVPRTDTEGSIEVAKSWGIEEGLWDRNWSDLSGGESQRIALAVAVGLKTAEVLLLDEPTSALDAGTSNTVEEYLKRQVHGGDGALKALVWITHSKEQGERVGTKFLYIVDGGVQEENINDVV